MDIKSKLKHIQEVKEFSEDLGLEFRGILSRYDESTKHKELHFLIVTPPNSLEEYVEEESIGTSNRELAKLNREYEKKGYDTLLDVTPAWNDCQINKGLLEGSYLYITGCVLHEGWHRTTKIPDKMPDNNLDEAIAMAIEELGSIEYCKEFRKRDLERARTHYHENKQLSEFIMKYHQKLKNAYKKPNWTELKPKIIAEAKAKRTAMVREFKMHTEDTLVSKDQMNNSYFYHEHIYYQHFKLVDALFRQYGLYEGIKFFKRYSDHEICISNMRRITGI